MTISFGSAAANGAGIFMVVNAQSIVKLDYDQGDVFIRDSVNLIADAAGLRVGLIEVLEL